MRRTLTVTMMAVVLALSTLTAALAGTGSITAPGEGEYVLSDTLSLRASAPSAEGGVAWAVRNAEDNPDCTDGASAGGTLAGNVNGANDDYSWENGEFSADIDVSTWADGEYCFAFNPEPYNTMRDQQNFFLATPTSKDACKDGGWQTFGSYENQGQCVSEFARER